LELQATFCSWYLTIISYYYDNISASYMVVNTFQHDHNKYIVVDYHFVHKHVAQGDLFVRYISPELQLGDIITKGCLLSLFNFFSRTISQYVPRNKLQGQNSVQMKNM